eukprot:TRINITY_DN2366_c0_g2_i6.p1 TRINITY_DN2366_c0_g2~~TRINITY_DN2366_c0_g2_i6.p1  ORF type:complete len:626 (+),score=147.01 TRINITY_DN2366_c0_g2_i6:271-2148(+)
MTIMDVFKDRLSKTKDLIAFEITRSGKVHQWTYQQYYDECCYFACALIELGIKERSSINIVGSNCPEWVIGCIGSIFANTIAAGVYTTNSPEACVYIANHSESELILVENMKQYNKYHSAKEAAKSVRYFIIWGEPVTEDLRAKGVLSWADVINMGHIVYAKHRETLRGRRDKQTPGTVCTFIYTSGTTSMPKACMLTHDSIIVSPFTQIKAYAERTKITNERDRIVSFLPLCHVAAFDMDVMVNLMLGNKLYFVDSEAIRGSLVKMFLEVRPTIFLGVPRIYEKIQEKIVSTIAKQSKTAQRIAQWAFKIGTETMTNHLANKPAPFGYTLANQLFFKKIKRAVGLDCVKLFMVGGGPNQRSTYDFFASIDIKVLGLYGLSETAGPITYSIPSFMRMYASGYAVYGTQIKIHNPDESGEGEICCRGRCVFVGYFKEEEKSRAVFDREGYYHTGDLGYLTPDGFLYVTGRIKDLMKTSGGEYVAPLFIESKFSAVCPIASHIVLIGDARRYLTALITIKCQPTKEGKLTLDIDRDVLETLREIGSDAKTLPEAAKCPKVAEYMAKCIERLNAQAISRVQQVKKWTILPREFSSEENEITPTMKLKKNVIFKKWADTIESMYRKTNL